MSEIYGCGTLDPRKPARQAGSALTGHTPADPARPYLSNGRTGDASPNHVRDHHRLARRGSRHAGWQIATRTIARTRPRRRLDRFIAGALVGVIIDVILQTGIYVAIIGHGAAALGAFVALTRFGTPDNA